MNIPNHSRYIYGFIIGICLEYIIRVDILIYPIIIMALMLVVMVIDLNNQSKGDKEYTKYYNARNKKLNKHSDNS